MKRPKVRIGTLMLLIVIAALAVALVNERRKSAALLVEAEQGRAAAEEMQARAVAQVRAFQANLQPAPPAPAR